ncbi:MAG TPA: hypothetical protein VM901_04560 [Bdellovibrionota bacterium]|jgi:hypothetical protein|nr:hypothetical protein [Bdellovibrionota bacterium]
MRIKNLSFVVSSVLFGLAACSTPEREYRSACKDGDEVCQKEARQFGTAGGMRESETLTEGFTGLWWSPKEDFFVAGLHRDNEPEPPQVGIYFGSLSDAGKRTIHWFPGEAPGGEDIVGVRVYKDDKSKPRVYFLTQLQNAGFYFPAFYHFSTDARLATTIYSRINCEQIEDVEIQTSALNIRCRVPSFGDEAGEEAMEYMDKKPSAKTKKVNAKAKTAGAPTDDASEEPPVDVVELSMDVDPTVTRLEAYKDEQHRDWLSGVLRACVQIKGHPNLCYPTQ